MDLRNGQWTRLASNNPIFPAPFGDRGVAYSQESAQPSARYRAAVWAVDDLVAYLWRSFNTVYLFNYLWMFNVSSFLWTWINGNYSGDGDMIQSTVSAFGKVGNKSLASQDLWPPARFRMIYWNDKSNNSLFLLGGYGIRNTSESLFPCALDVGHKYAPTWDGYLCMSIQKHKLDPFPTFGISTSRV
jgi:hypothetical protein